MIKSLVPDDNSNFMLKRSQLHTQSEGYIMFHGIGGRHRRCRSKCTTVLSTNRTMAVRHQHSPHGNSHIQKHAVQMPMHGKRQAHQHTLDLVVN